MEETLIQLEIDLQKRESEQRGGIIRNKSVGLMFRVREEEDPCYILGFGLRFVFLVSKMPLFVDCNITFEVQTSNKHVSTH